jgi:hypothetical protein
MQTTTDKQHVIELLDQLDAGQFAAVVHLLEVMADPVARAIAAAPLDDEPVTEEDRRRFQEGQNWFARRDGKGIPMADVLADFGLKPEDFTDNAAV